MAQAGISPEKMHILVRGEKERFVSAKWSLYYQLLKLCLPVFYFQTTEASLSDLLLQQMDLATPVMAYVYGEDEAKDELTLLAAMENSGKQEDRQDADLEISTDDQKANGDEAEAQDPIAAAGAENVAAAATPVWTKQVEVNRDKLLDYDYLVKNFYRIDRTTTIDSSELNPGQLLAKDLTIDTNVGGPVILIYHTHSQEGFVDSDGAEGMTVMGLGDRLTSLLQDTYGIQVLHHRGKYDVDGRDYAYSNAEPEIKQVLADNPTIQVVIDLHRDGVGDDVHLVTDIGGKQTAKIMFFNGLSRTTSTGPIDHLQNPNLQDNLATSLQMQIAAAELYPGFTRPVFLKGYRYNMHMCPKSMLIEVGAQTNTFEEVYNAMDPLANILAYVLLGQSHT